MILVRINISLECFDPSEVSPMAPQFSVIRSTFKLHDHLAARFLLGEFHSIPRIVLSILSTVNVISRSLFV